MKKGHRGKRRGGGRWRFSFARFFRRRASKKYADRFVQGIDYVEMTHPTYKYRMIRDRVVQTRILGHRVSTIFFDLYEDGRLVIHKGYCWDGPSGPTVDTPSFMRSSAVHDVLFQILREGLIPYSGRVIFLSRANSELRQISKVDGMMWPRYDVVKFSVDKFGAKHSELVA